LRNASIGQTAEEIVELPLLGEFEPELCFHKADRFGAASEASVKCRLAASVRCDLRSHVLNDGEGQPTGRVDLAGQDWLEQVRMKREDAGDLVDEHLLGMLSLGGSPPKRKAQLPSIQQQMDHLMPLTEVTS